VRPRHFQQYRRPARPRLIGRRTARLIALLLAGLLAAVLGRHRPEQLTAGAVRVLDGDSLRQGGEEIRLFGIDAPEHGQSCRDERAREWPCGREAARQLRRLIDGRKVDCRGRERDRYRRLIAVCTAGAVEANAWMVREGFAVAYRRHAGDYLDEEAEAHAARRGLWRGTFTPPEQWRKEHPRPYRGYAGAVPEEAD